jgi:hypothetical protein
MLMVGKTDGGRDHSKDLRIHENISEWILGKQGQKLWIGFMWHRIRTCDRPL